MTLKPDWRWRAKCTPAMVDSGDQQYLAKTICPGCPVRRECLAEGLDKRTWESGVYGGLTDRERRAVRKRYPSVKSWTKLISESKDFDAVFTMMKGTRSGRIADKVESGSP